MLLPLLQVPTQLLRPSTPSETHMILKDNALFLLQLAKSRKEPTNSGTKMEKPNSSVAEPPTDLTHRKISAPPPKVSFVV